MEHRRISVSTQNLTFIATVAKGIRSLSSTKMLNFSATEFMVVCCSVLLIVLLLTEVLDWTQILSSFETEGDTPIQPFGYSDHNGPNVWKILYPESAGNNQSPINITGNLALVMEPSDPLVWNGYERRPISMTIANDSTTVVLSGSWGNDPKPQIQGGPLTSVYNFNSLIFHWGPSNNEGSEHTIDYIRYPMELQVVHVKQDHGSPVDSIMTGAKDGLVIVSFLFQITNADNPYLDNVVTNLWRIARPGSKAYVPSIPLEWIFPTFDRGFYTYNGSLTQPPCSEIVTWIVQPEPIAISSLQVEQFKKICSLNGPILSNCRPVQELNERDVFLYE